MAKNKQPGALALFHPPVRQWFEQAFAAPTLPQQKGWPAIARGGHTLLLAPTGTGKTLAAFLHCLDRLMFESPRPDERRCRVLYVSPLKALAVDVERNLRAPLQGIARMAAELGEQFRTPEVAIRTGDTPQKERARFSRDPAEILITTPESLFLMLTSNVRDALRSVDTVIIDEIHSLVPTKRGAHLALSLERLDAIAEQKIQRIGLSATQRPLEEVARFLGGVQTPGRSRKRAADPDPETEIREEFATHASVAYRPVEIVDAGIRKSLELTIEVPVEDMARLGEHIPATAPERDEPSRSIWSAIHPRLLELIRAHTSTLIFVNGRRGAERLAGALNELAGEVLVQAHHGSIAREQRQAIEENLKAGTVRGLVATSTLELGIDMGAINLVVQIEAPPSVASGMQRIGRAGHSVGAPSRGVLFPKFRGDLVACAALTRAMQDGHVEATRYPRNPLDVLAQQLVAMCAVESWEVDELFTAVRRAASFAELSRPAFEGVLDMLSGRYPSDAFAELRPRLTWDRNAGTLTAREGAKRLAVANAGTIPDRGLYGVFLAGSEGKPGARVGELDEEMVFESKVGETFVLGASTWRIEEITHDRVLVTPAPGEPGRMPFWRGDAPTRPLELGLRIGALVRELGASTPRAATERLVHHHALSELAAKNLLAYLADQRAATHAVPDDRTVLIERGRDEVGDWRVCVLSPLGGQVHAPWSMAVAAKIQAQLGTEPEVLYTNDGFALRLPESDAPPDPQLFVPAPEELEKLVMDELGGTALFAARFREAAGRALLLPKRRPGGRTALWQQRKRAADLLAVASHHASFPMLLEAYRECLRDVFDIPALERTLAGIRAGRTRVEVADPPSPSPFASTLLFGFVANYIYEGDAPLAERRAQALAIDHAQLRELMGEAELRELLDPRDLHQLEAELQHVDPKRHARSPDAVHDLLLRLGDLSRDEISKRTTGEVDAWLESLERARRIVKIQLAGEARFIAAEDAARFRDGANVDLPEGIPAALLEPVADARGDLLARHGRTHGPFTASEVAHRFGLSLGDVEPGLRARVDAGRLLEGAFRPTGTGAELCDPDVLRTLRARARARLRAEVEPVEPAVLGRFLASWQGVSKPGRGRDALLRAVEKLQGLALPASVLESEILPARVEGYLSGDLGCAGGVGRGHLARRGEARRAGRPRRGLSGRLRCRAHSARGDSGSAAGSGSARGQAAAAPRRTRGVVLQRAARVARWLRGRAGEGALGPGVEGPGHQRHLEPAARPRRIRRASRETRAGHGARSAHRPQRAAGCVRALVALERTRWIAVDRHQLVRCAGSPAARALRAGGPRGGAQRGAPRRLRGRLPRAQGDGGRGQGASRLLRVRARRRAVRAPARARPAPRAPRTARSARGPLALGGGSGQPLWRALTLARERRGTRASTRRRSARGARERRARGLCQQGCAPGAALPARERARAKPGGGGGGIAAGPARRRAGSLPRGAPGGGARRPAGDRASGRSHVRAPGLHAHHPGAPAPASRRLGKSAVVSHLDTSI